MAMLLIVSSPDQHPCLHLHPMRAVNAYVTTFIITSQWPRWLV